VTDPVLRIADLHLRRAARPILVGVTLDVHPGEFVAMMGPSGSGKTTVLRVIAGLERFEKGRVNVDGVVLEGGGPTPVPTLRQLRRKVGMVFQFHCLFEHLSALNNICLAPVHAHHVTRDNAERRARDLLAAFGVQHRADALPRELSGGEAQRVAIARALAVDPPVLLMDEPTASLDPLRRAELGELLRRLLADARRGDA
jgi:polar amino acid transport system ATP-binding protein